MMKALLDVLCPDRKTKLLSASSGGARNITERNAGSLTHLGAAFSENFALIRV